MEVNKVYNEDCLIGMNRIPDKSVDMILCDLPYGTTNLEWDTPIPFTQLWEQYNRVIKDNGVIALTGSQPFTTDIINSNRKMFRYELIWEKTMKTGFLDAYRRPLKSHENVLIFYKKQPIYNPQMTIAEVLRSDAKDKKSNRSQHYNNFNGGSWVEDGKRFPSSVVKFSNWNGLLFGQNMSQVKHQSKKPVSLFSYLIRSYTNPHDIVLDNCIGSGTTAIACIREFRNYIGFEKDERIYNDCVKRIASELAAPFQLTLIT